MKNIKLISLLTLSLVASPALAKDKKQVIPKVTLASCEIPKVKLAKWFYNFRDEEELAKIVDPMTIELKRAAPAGRQELAGYYRVSIKGKNAAGKVIAQKELDQVAVNHQDNMYSVAYAPYSVSATNAQPFSWIIEGNELTGPAQGAFMVTPLQSTDSTPMEVVEMGCQIFAEPAEAVKITRADLAKMTDAEQFDVLHSLSRLGFTGRYAKNEHANEELMGREKFRQLKLDLSAYFNSLPFPTPRKDWKGRGPTKVEEVDGDKCGQVEIWGLRPIYDTVTMEAIRQGKDELKSQFIGFEVYDIDCGNVARIVTYPEAQKPYNHKWHLNGLILTTQGLIKGFEAEAETPYLDGY